MVVSRPLSGRSGRRFGSQNPGTNTPAAGCASAGGSAGSKAANETAVANRASPVKTNADAFFVARADRGWRFIRERSMRGDFRRALRLCKYLAGKCFVADWRKGISEFWPSDGPLTANQSRRRRSAAASSAVFFRLKGATKRPSLSIK